MHEANPKTDLQYVAEHRLSAAHRLAQLQKRTAFVRGHRGVGGGRAIAQLLLAPAVLEQVETHAPLEVLVGVILAFGAALFVLYGLNAYLKENALYGRIAVRVKLLMQVNTKIADTSFPNLLDTAFRKAAKGDQHLLQQRRKHGSHLEHPDRPADQPDRLWRLSGVAVGAASAAAGGGAGHHGGKLPVQQPHQRLGLPPPGRGEGIP